MKKLLAYKETRPLLGSMLLMCCQLNAMAQDANNANINTEQVESWFSQNWMWVAIGAGVLLLIIALAGSSRSKTTVKKTTIVKEEDPSGVVKTTTTEIRE